MNDNKICSCVMAVVWITLDPDCYLSQTTSLFFLRGGGKAGLDGANGVNRMKWKERVGESTIDGISYRHF